MFRFNLPEVPHSFSRISTNLRKAISPFLKSREQVPSENLP